MQTQPGADPYDVLIAGYGPAGATAANLLARRGYRVALIEQSLAIYDKPRAITADQEAMRVFQECGLAHLIEPITVPHPGTDFVGVDDQIIKRFDPQPPPRQLTWEPSWMFVQPDLEAILRQGVARYPNVTVFLGHAVLNLDQDDKVVRLKVERLCDNNIVEFTGRYALGCDGARSTLRRQLDSRVIDLEFDEWWMVVDAWKRRDVELPPRLRQYCKPTRPGTYIVGPGDLRRWEIKMMPGETPEMFENTSKILDVLSEFVDVSALDLCRTAIYRFHALVMEDWQKERVFLVGDAAHQMPPFLGQGLCAAIRDVYNLIWKIDAVERLGASRSILATYGEERKPHVRTVVELAKEFGLIIGELDEKAARARDRRLKALLESGAAETVRQKFIPGLTAGLIDLDFAGKPRTGAGTLFVQPWVQRKSDDAWHRLDDIVGSRFLAVTDVVTADNMFDERIARLWRRLDAIEVVILPFGHADFDIAGKLVVVERERVFADWLASLDAKIALVRPDRYVYGTARNLEELNLLVGRLYTQFLGSAGETGRRREQHGAVSTST